MTVLMATAAVKMQTVGAQKRRYLFSNLSDVGVSLRHVRTVYIYIYIYIYISCLKLFAVIRSYSHLKKEGISYGTWY